MTRTLLMLHGVGCTGGVWAPLAAAFEAAGWRCRAPTLFPDKRLKDAPPADLSFLTLRDYAETARGWAAQAQVETGDKPVVIGHSMGGLLAQKLAEEGLVRAAVFLTPAAPAGCQAADLRPLFTFWNIVQANDPTRGYKVWRTGFSWGVLNAVPVARHDAIYAEAVYDSGRVYRDLGKPGEDPHRTATVDDSRITIPTLTVGATKDRATPISSVRKTAAKYARGGLGDYLEYPNHAHWIVDEPGTERVAADILAWLGAKAG